MLGAVPFAAMLLKEAARCLGKGQGLGCGGQLGRMLGLPGPQRVDTVSKLLPYLLAVSLARFGKVEVPGRAEAHPALDTVDLVARHPVGGVGAPDFEPQPAAVVVLAGLARPDQLVDLLRFQIAGFSCHGRPSAPLTPLLPATAASPQKRRVRFRPVQCSPAKPSVGMPDL